MGLQTDLSVLGELLRLFGRGAPESGLSLSVALPSLTASEEFLGVVPALQSLSVPLSLVCKVCSVRVEAARTCPPSFPSPGQSGGCVGLEALLALGC